MSLLFPHNILLKRPSNPRQKATLSPFIQINNSHIKTRAKSKRCVECGIEGELFMLHNPLRHISLTLFRVRELTGLVAVQQVTHAAIQFTVYEELRKIILDFRTEGSSNPAAASLESLDYAVLGASSKLAAIVSTYPFQVIRARLQQRPSNEGIPRYMDSWHVMKETARFEGVRGFYKGISANVLKNAPASSVTFIVYENVLNMLKLARRKDEDI